MANDSNSSDRNSTVLIDHIRDGVVVLRLNRPDRLNAMTVDLVAELHSSLDCIASDIDCRAVILTGEGRGFCAGLDLAGYGVAPGSAHLGAVQRQFAAQKHIASLMSHFRSIPQPIICAVNGPAAGGGLALVLGSDIRIAARSAKFNVAFIRVGYSGCDIGTSWLLPRIVGVARAQELMLTGRVIGSDEAYRIGLVVDVVEDEELMDVAMRKAEEMLRNAPFAVSLTKEAMWASLEIPAMQTAIELENRQQILSAQVKDAEEAMAAFREKRAPNYLNL